MGPKTPVTEKDFFRQPLREQINLKHPLVRLADLINWERLGVSMSASFVSPKGRPATSPRLIAGLLYLQHTFDLSDEDVVWQWVENPYWQVFTGETYLQTEPPLDPSSLTRWRKRLGEAGVEELLTETIDAAKRAGVIRASSAKRVVVDTTVMPRAIAHPTDSRLLERCREHLVKAAASHGLKLRQNYNREAARLAGQISRYAHAKQYRRMRKALRTLRSRVGRVMRDVERQFDKVTGGRQAGLQELIGLTKRILTQKPKDKNKLYALHAPEVECLGAHAVRIRREGVNHDHAQGRARGRRALDAGQPVRWAHAGRSAGAGGHPERCRTGNRRCRLRLQGRRDRRREDLPSRLATRHHSHAARDDQAAQCHRAGHRAHEGRWQARQDWLRVRWATRSTRFCAAPVTTCA
jgi:transposase, IS5 family